MSGELLDRIAGLGVLPVIAIPSVEAAVPLARALCDGGIAAIEVTLRNPWALESVAAIRRAIPDMLIGAGTVLRENQIGSAKSAGADFLVSPGLDPDLIHAAQSAGLPIVPGVSNPSEIMAAVKCGLAVLKFFPAECFGGLAALKLMRGPFPDVRFVPTGGMCFENIGAYLGQPFVIACGGSFMAPAAEVKAGNWGLVTENCRRAVAIARQARGEGSGW